MPSDKDSNDSFQFGENIQVELVVHDEETMRLIWERHRMPTDHWERFERDGHPWQRCRWEEETEKKTLSCQVDKYEGIEGSYCLMDVVVRSEPALDAKRMAVGARAMDSFRLPTLKMKDYTGQKTAYHLHLPEVFEPSLTSAAAFDRFFLAGSSGEVGIGVIIHQKKLWDASIMASYILGDVTLELGHEPAGLKQETLQCQGRTWEQFEYRNVVDGATLVYIQRVYAGPEGAYQLVALASAEKMLIYRETILEAFDKFELPPALPPSTSPTNP